VLKVADGVSESAQEAEAGASDGKGTTNTLFCYTFWQNRMIFQR